MDSPLRIKSLEKLDGDYSMYTWPCAPLLAKFVFSKRKEISGKRVLELGAGTAIPGIVAAKCGAMVTLSDREDVPLIREHLQNTVSVNGVADSVSITGISWGHISPQLLELPPQDYIIASDCFYDTKDFEDVLATVSFIMEKNAQCIFWTSYQERSANRTLDHLLLRWNLRRSIITMEEEEDDGSRLLIEGPPNHEQQSHSSLQLWEIAKIHS